MRFRKIILSMALLFSAAVFAQNESPTGQQNQQPTQQPSPQQPSSTNTSSTTNFPAQITLDNRQWKLGYKQNDDTVEMAEYILPNESVNQWTELLTLQKFKYLFKKELTPKKFAELEIVELKKKPEYKATYSVNKANDKEAIFEFKIQSPVAEQQNELQRIIKTPDDKIMVLHYVIKKVDMGADQRNKWTNILNNINPDQLNQSSS